jgi:transmembrane sensor
MIDDEACRWTARIDRGLSGAERAALDLWLAADARHAGALLRAEAALSLLDRARALSHPESESEGTTAPVSRRGALRYGAGGIAAAIVGSLAWRLWPAGQSIQTALGEIRKTPLGDGSIATVNSASKIRLAFTEGRRDVELTSGEAFFEVAKDRSRPFTVSSGGVFVQAVGTAFDVRRHPGASEIVVTEGVVKIWSDASREPVLLAAGKRAVMSDQAGVEIADQSVAAADQQLAWREGRIILDNISLGAAAAEFNRYHVRQLEIDPALADRELVGWFRTSDLDGFVAASAAIVGGSVDRHGKVIAIRKI